MEDLQSMVLSFFLLSIQLVHHFNLFCCCNPHSTVSGHSLELDPRVLWLVALVGCCLAIVVCSSPVSLILDCVLCPKSEEFLTLSHCQTSELICSSNHAINSLATHMVPLGKQEKETCPTCLGVQ